MWNIDKQWKVKDMRAVNAKVGDMDLAQILAAFEGEQ